MEVAGIEIAALLGCSRQWVNQMAQEEASFPTPEAELSGGCVWSWEAIEQWAKATGRKIVGMAPQ